MAGESPLGSPASGAEWLIGGSKMGRVVREMDWAKTPLGPISGWPSSLRTTVSLVLSSNFPISLAWGPEHTQIYNDGYWPICGGKHPTAMGQDFSECWASAWPVIGDAFRSAEAGTTAFLEDQRMFLDRLGYLEETFFTFSFSPIRDESGAIAGLFHPVTETSSKMIGQRRTRALRDLTTGTLEARSIDEGLQLVAATIAEYDLDVPFLLFYRIDADGQSATLLAQAGIPGDCPAGAREVDLTGTEPGWPLADVANTGATRLLSDVRARFPGLTCGPYPESVGSAFVQPIIPPGHRRPVCVMIAGVSSRLPLDESYRSFYDLLAAGVTSVITNVEAYDAERQRAEALAEVDRARTAFFTNVSHELRTPLTLLLAPIEDELNDLNNDAGEAAADDDVTLLRRERLDMAHRNSLRLLRLVNTLLDFARIEDGRLLATFEPTDLAALTSDLASNFRSVCERAGLDLVVDCPPLSEPILVDPDMWERIVLNLLSNAFKFTLEGQITVTLQLSGDRVELAVADTGTGIPADQVAQVFDRFHRVPGTRGRSHEGTGIGLAFVRELVHQHGGTIEASSRLHQGSTFTVRIPRGMAHISAQRIADPKHRSSGGHALPFVAEANRWLPDQGSTVPEPGAGPLDPGADPQSEAGPTGPIGIAAARPRIIWADDNADMRQYVYRLLSERYEVEAVPDGLAALQSARARPPELVVTDVMMPGLDGFGLLRELRGQEETRTVPVILLSARAGEESRIEGLAAGADDYLVKPFSARELLARVQAHVQLATLRRETEVARRAAERAELIAASEAQLRLITDGLPILISYVDAGGRYRFTNRAYEEWFGLSRDKLVGASVGEIWAGDIAEQTKQVMQRVLAGETVTYDFDLPNRNGLTRRLRSTYLPHAGPDGSVLGFFGYIEDDTERSQAAAQIQRLNDELESRVLARTAELAAANHDLESFSYSVSHDLRAPLRSIDGFTRLIQDSYAERLPPEGQRQLGLVRKNTLGMGHLIDGLLAMAKLGRGAIRLEVVDHHRLLQECVEDVRASRPDRAIDVYIDPLGPCEADPTLLRQVWANLLGNAVKYSQPRPRTVIRTGSRVQDDEVVYFCQDNGVGFDMRYAGKLFEAFQRLHRAEEFEGIGIGLATVQRIVQRHQGRIWADAELGQGATFYFTLAGSAADRGLLPMTAPGARETLR